MPGGRYNVILEGRILDGHTPEGVRQGLARLFKTDTSRIDRMFAQAPIVIKKDLDYPTASTYKDALRRAGAAGRIAETVDTAPPPPLSAGGGPQPDDSAQTRPAPQMAGARRQRPSAVWYVGSIALFLLPMIIGGVILTQGIVSRLGSGIDAPAPGKSLMSIEHADTYVLWYEPGRVGNDPLRPGYNVDVQLTERTTGESLRLQPVTMDWVETANGVERKALGRIEIERPGRYHLEVKGDFPQTTFLLRRSLFSRWQTTILLPVLLCIFGWIGGPLSALYLFVKRSRTQHRVPLQAMAENEERKWAMLSHMGTFAAFFVPFGNLIAPLLIWQLKKTDSEFIVIHSKESLNFQISVFLYAIAAAVSMILVIGFFLLPAIGIFNIVMVVVAGIRANEGYIYRYPLTIRFIR